MNRALDLPMAMVLGATIALSLKGVFAQFAYAAGLSVAGVLLLRFAIAAPLLWGTAWAGARRSGATGLAIAPRDWLLCLATGSLFFVATLADFTALTLIPVSLSRTILYTFPAFVLLFDALKERRLPSARQLACFVVAYAGIGLIVAPDGFGDVAADQWMGMGWSVLSASSYAGFLVCSQAATRRIGSARFTAASNTTTLIWTLLYASLLADGDAFELSAAGALWATLIAVFCTVVPFLLMLEAVRRAGAARFSLLSLSGPAITALMAWMLLGEVLGPVQLLGLGVVLLGIAVLENRVPLPRWPRPAAARRHGSAPGPAPQSPATPG